MPQSLTRLPQTADFKMERYPIRIRDHEVENWGVRGLLGKIMRVISHSDSNKETLCQFEKHGISFEMVIEYCACELEYNTDILADIMYGHYYDDDVLNEKGVILDLESIHIFSKSEAGRIIAGQFVEKIRNCGDWEELYDEMQMTGKFRKDMKRRIKRELKKQLASESK